mgnify:CR=1 FL=1
MTAEEAMKEIDRITDDYIEAKITELRALSLICRVVGEYQGSKP